MKKSNTNFKETIKNMQKKKTMEFKNIFLFIYFFASILLLIPSINFIMKNGTISAYSQDFTYIMERLQYKSDFILNIAIFVSIFLLLTLLYFIILKNVNKIFKSKKKMIIFIIIIAIIFALIIPQTSRDVYSYIGNGWVDTNYNENPYYTSIQTIINRDGYVSEMFSKVARCWLNELFVYGPAWSLTCKLLTTFCNGSIDIALLTFKIASLAIFLGCCYLIYKITNKKLFVAMFALNPLVLFEGLTNVHNDLFLVFFTLLAIYFVTKKRNLYLAVLFIAVATAIKYLSIIILPFIVIYYLKDEKLKERIIKTIICAIEFVAIILAFYMVYIRDISVISGLFLQQNKYSRSIALILLQMFNGDTKILNYIKIASLGIFALAYAIVVFKLFFDKNLKRYNLQKILRKYNVFILIFTFVLITNFNAWYLLWLFPTIMWQKPKTIRLMIYLSIGAIMSYAVTYYTYLDGESVGPTYFYTMVGTAICFFMIENLLKNRINKKEVKKLE